MDNEIKKNLASNWFKLLQNAICDDINKLEKHETKFKSLSEDWYIKHDQREFAECFELMNDIDRQTLKRCNTQYLESKEEKDRYVTLERGRVDLK